MKGIAKIQLFDAVSGKLVSERVEENIVTQAAERLLTLPLRKEFAGSFHSNAAVNATYLNRMLPMATELFGGVLLFKDQIEATETTFFPPKNAVPVGHAGSPYSGESPYKGTYNSSESSVITDTSGNPVGYRHVWDFATDKANGTIGCICLTSVGGGEVGWNGYIDNTSSHFNVFSIAYNGGISSLAVGASADKLFRATVTSASTSSGATFNSAPASFPSNEIKAIYMKESTGEVWYVCRKTSPNNVALFKVKFPRNFDIKLNTVLPTTSFETTYLYTGSSPVPVSSTYFYEGNIHAVVATSETSITHTTFNLDGDIVSSKVVSFFVPLFAYGETASAPLFFYDGFYYCYLKKSEATPNTIGKFDESGALVSTYSLPPSWPEQGYRISFSSALKCPIAVSTSYNSFYRGNQAFVFYGSRIIPCFVQQMSSSGIIPFAIEELDGDVGEGCSYVSTSDNGSRLLSICMYPAYLATINNLASPVTKTSAMTMKLVYELYDA